jgi:hypothetical protein
MGRTRAGDAGQLGFEEGAERVGGVVEDGRGGRDLIVDGYGVPGEVIEKGEIATTAAALIGKRAAGQNGEPAPEVALLGEGTGVARHAEESGLKGLAGGVFVDALITAADGGTEQRKGGAAKRGRPTVRPVASGSRLPQSKEADYGLARSLARCSAVSVSDSSIQARAAAGSDSSHLLRWLVRNSVRSAGDWICEYSCAARSRGIR